MEKLSIQSKNGLYFVALLVMGMPLFIFGFTKIFSLGETLELSRLDIFWSISCFVCGLLLLVRYKIAWIIAMVQIVLVAVFNMGELFANWGEDAVIQYNFQFLFSISMLCSIFLVASYYKYPYLDRRDTLLFGIADRYKVQMKATVNEHIFGEVVSASISGVLFKSEGELKMDENNNIILTIPEMNLKSVPMELVSKRDSELRLKFKWPGLGMSFKIKKQLKGFPKED